MPYDGECRIYQTDTNLVASIACYTEGEMRSSCPTIGTMDGAKDFSEKEVQNLGAGKNLLRNFATMNRNSQREKISSVHNGLEERVATTKSVMATRYGIYCTI